MIWPLKVGCHLASKPFCFRLEIAAKLDSQHHRLSSSHLLPAETLELTVLSESQGELKRASSYSPQTCSGQACPANQCSPTMPLCLSSRSVPAGLQPRGGGQDSVFPHLPLSPPVPVHRFLPHPSASCPILPPHFKLQDQVTRSGSSHVNRTNMVFRKSVLFFNKIRKKNPILVFRRQTVNLFLCTPATKGSNTQPSLHLRPLPCPGPFPQVPNRKAQ